MMYRLVKKISDENMDRNVREQWIAYLPFMAMGFVKSMEYEEFKNQSIITIDTRPTEEILAEVEEVKRQLGE